MADLAGLGHRQELEAVERVRLARRGTSSSSRSPCSSSREPPRGSRSSFPRRLRERGAAALGLGGLVVHALERLREPRSWLGQLHHLLGRLLGRHRETGHLAELGLGE